MIRLRCLAALGLCVDELSDLERPVSEYAEAALSRSAPEPPFLTVMKPACHSCIDSKYAVSNVCHGCVARPCAVNCPKDAIFFRDRQAHIDSGRCIACGRCQDACPYHAIVKIPVPCEEACPVAAIKKGPDGKTTIDFEKCISCGRCMRACPFGAIEDRSQIVDVLRAFDSERPVVALCAPAMVGQFGASFEQLVAAVLEIGFDSVVEVAHGADEACRMEAEDFQRRVLEGDDAFMTTSCCSAYNEAVEKHLSGLKPFVSKTPTPLHLTAAHVREELPEATTVFIGPCAAKRLEGSRDDCVDYVLTFEELHALFAGKDVDPASLDGRPVTDAAEAFGRGFPLSGGVAAAVAGMCDNPEAVRPIQVETLCRQGIRQLKSYATGNCPGNLVEVMACEGGCINGAGVLADPNVAIRRVRRFLEEPAPTPS